MGRGQLISGTETSGVLRRADTLDQVFALLKDPALDETIIVCESASAASVSPILPRIKGVVCESGGATSHLAIIAREFNIACLMGTAIEPGAELEGTRGRITGDGELVLGDGS